MRESLSQSLERDLCVIGQDDNNTCHFILFNMLAFAIGLILLFILCYADNNLLAKILPKPIYLIFLFPGIATHEISHFFGALLTGTPVHDIQLISSTGGHVIHEKPKLPILGQFIISFAPFIIGMLLVYLISRFIPISAGGHFSIPYTPLHLTLPIVTAHIRIIHIVLIYLGLSLLLTLTPSRQDITASSGGILSIIAVCYILYRNSWLSIPTNLTALIWYTIYVLIAMLIILWPVKALLKK